MQDPDDPIIDVPARGQPGIIEDSFPDGGA